MSNILFFSGEAFRGFSRRLVSSTSLSSLVTFTRASAGSFFGSDNLLQSAANNEPRFTNAQGGVSGLLIEKSSTNLEDRSFCDTGWSVNAGATKTPNTLVSPTGATDATELTLGASSASGIFDTWATISPSTVYTYSAFVKHVSGSSQALRFGSDSSADWGGSTAFRAVFDFSTGTFTTLGSAITDSNVDILANGWFRISITGQSDAGASGTSVIFFFNGGSPDTGVFGVYGAQIEELNFASSFIETDGSQVTRSADVASVDLSNQPWFDANTGTVFTNFSTVGWSKDDQTIWAVSDGTVSGSIGLSIDSVTQDMTLDVVDSASQAQLVLESPATHSTGHKVAARYKANDIGASLDGGASLVDSAATIPSVTGIFIGDIGAGDRFGNCVISELSYYGQEFTNSQLEVKTS